MFEHLPFWPSRASTAAGQVDALFIFLLMLCGIVCLAIFALIVVFAIRFRRRAGHEAVHIEGSNALEFTWTVVPVCIFLCIFVWGAYIYFQERTPPQGAADVYTVAKQWMWKFQHEEGQREINELHVPVGRDVRMIMTSQDAIHSFYVPAFRIKQDVLPGRYTTAWFHATKAWNLSPVLRRVLRDHALRDDWRYRRDGARAISGVAQRGWLTLPWRRPGRNSFRTGCTTCHRSDIQGRGPNLAGLFGKPVLLEDGRTMIADENYIRE